MTRYFCDKCGDEIRMDLGVVSYTPYSAVVFEGASTASTTGAPVRVEGRFEHLCRRCRDRILELVPTEAPRA